MADDSVIKDEQPDFSIHTEISYIDEQVIPITLNLYFNITRVKQ